MREILHILTSKADGTATEIIRAQSQMPESHVEVADLNAGESDYDELVKKIFRAESVQVW